LLHGFFTPEEIAPVAADFEQVFGSPTAHFDKVTQAAQTDKTAKTEDAPAFNIEQFKNFENLPFACSPALNLIALHPRLINLAKRALQTDKVHLYQGQAWAKYTGETNYEQPFHCDFGNHTLTVPSTEAIHNSITFIILVTDVTEDLGPTHYVPKSLSQPIAGIEEALSRPENLTKALLPHSHSTAAGAGALFAYGIDVFHRGTNLIAPEGFRYVVTSCFRRTDNTQIGYSAWPFHSTKPWHNLINHATPEQLGCLGIPLPGDRYWNDETLRLSALRWPDWDMSAWQIR